MLRALALIALAVGPAMADIDNDKADAVFKEALALRDKDPVAACAKFEEALGYNPQAISTRLNVALCDEKLGRIASAVDKFTEVADRARVQNLTEYLNVAEEHLAKLTPELSFLTVTFVEPDVADMKVMIDDKVVPADKLAKLPIDPGERVIVVTAPGRMPFRKKLVVMKQTKPELQIPRLERGGSHTLIGKITVAAGGATAITGITLGIVARSRYNDAHGRCQPDPMVAGHVLCSQADKQKVDKALTLGNVGTAVTLIGVAAAGVGGYLWWRGARRGHEQRGLAYLGPHVGADGAGLVAAGRF